MQWAVRGLCVCICVHVCTVCVYACAYDACVDRVQLITATSREEEEILAAQASRLQSMYRGYRLRATTRVDDIVEGSDCGVAPDERQVAAAKITKFIRLVGQWKKEEQEMDAEFAARRIQESFM
jgi:hypothetical protein